MWKYMEKRTENSLYLCCDGNPTMAISLLKMQHLQKSAQKLTQMWVAIPYMELLLQVFMISIYISI